MMDISNVVACDTETKLIEQGLLAPPLVCVSTCDSSLEPKLYHHSDAFEVVRDLFLHKNIVGQNFAYDAAVIAAKWPELLPIIFDAYFDNRIVDTMLNDRLIHIARGTLDGFVDRHGVKHVFGYSLEALAERYGLGALDKDTWRFRYGEFIDVPLSEWPAGAVDYPKKDALVTLKVFFEQLAFDDFLGDAPMQARAAFGLQLMSCRGMITDAKSCADFIEATKEDIKRAGRVLRLEGIVREDGSRDTKAAKVRMEQVCAELGMPVPKTKRTKNSSEKWKPGTALDAEATRDTGDSVLMDYSLYTSSNTALNRAELLQKGSQGLPLQTSFQTLMETGRISSRAPSPPLVGENFTNLPRKPGLRECFVARPGFVFCSLDLDMAEAIAVAQIHYWVFGRSTLGDALREKKDIHCMLGAEMMGCPYEEVLANKKVGKYKKERQNAKYGNYGYWGGMGPQKFMETTNKGILRREDKINLGIATKIKNGWKNTWAPESEDYFKWVVSLMGEGQATIKQFVSGRVRANLDYCTTANTFFQGLVADGIKEAMVYVQHEMYCRPDSPLFGSRLLLNLHDELFGELVEEKAHEAAKRMQEILLGTLNTKYTPDVHITGEPALMRRWWKAAPSLYVNGGLVPAKPQVDGKDVIVVPENVEAVWVPDL